MDFPKNLQTCENLLVLEEFNKSVRSMIVHALGVLGENDNIYSIDQWRTYELTSKRAFLPGTNSLFMSELRSHGIHRTVTGMHEFPEDDADSQLWLCVHYTILTYPEDEQEERTMRFPARYLFMSDEEIKKAWERHMDVAKRGLANSKEELMAKYVAEQAQKGNQNEQTLDK